MGNMLRVSQVLARALHSDSTRSGRAGSTVRGPASLVLGCRLRYARLRRALGLDDFDLRLFLESLYVGLLQLVALLILQEALQVRLDVRQGRHAGRPRVGHLDDVVAELGLDDAADLAGFQ